MWLLGQLSVQGHMLQMQTAVEGHGRRGGKWRRATAQAVEVAEEPTEEGRETGEAADCECGRCSAGSEGGQAGCSVQQQNKGEPALWKTCCQADRAPASEAARCSEGRREAAEEHCCQAGSASHGREGGWRRRPTGNADGGGDRKIETEKASAEIRWRQEEDPRRTAGRAEGENGEDEEAGSRLAGEDAGDGAGHCLDQGGASAAGREGGSWPAITRQPPWSPVEDGTADGQVTARTIKGHGGPGGDAARRPQRRRNERSHAKEEGGRDNPRRGNACSSFQTEGCKQKQKRKPKQVDRPSRSRPCSSHRQGWITVAAVALAASLNLGNTWTREVPEDLEDAAVRGRGGDAICVVPPNPEDGRKRVYFDLHAECLELETLNEALSTEEGTGGDHDEEDELECESQHNIVLATEAGPICCAPVSQSAKLKLWTAPSQVEEVPTNFKLRTDFDKFENWHQMTKIALAAIRCEAVVKAEQGPPNAYVIYTDGSVDKQHKPDEHEASWAMVVLAKRTAADGSALMSLVGYAAATLMPGEHDNNGRVVDSTDAELMGGAAALTWAREATADGEVNSVEIHVDNSAALSALQGQSALEAERPYANVLAARRRDLVASGVRLEGRWVKAHSGQPWNEASDVLANNVRSTKLMRRSGVWFVDYAKYIYPEGLENNEYRAVSFLRHASDELRAQYPDWLEDKWVAPMPSYAAGSEELAAHYEQCKVQDEEETRQMSIKMVTANVCTMADKKIGGQHKEMLQALNVAGRFQNIMNQMRDANATVVAIQEARMQGNDCWESQDYIVSTTSASPRGEGGCQVWVRKVIQQGDAKYRVTKKDLTLLGGDHRRLLLAVRAGPIAFDVLCLHVPCVNTTDLESWWWDTTELASKRDSTRPMMVLMDANTQLAETDLPAIGGLAHGRHSEHAYHLQSFLKAFDLWLPATFEEHHSGQLHTWESRARELRCRIDYVAIPIEWRHEDVRSYVDEADITMESIDHYPVACEATLMLRSAQSLPRRRRLECDPEALRQLPKGSLEKELRDAIPRVPWQVEPATHLHAVNQAVRTTIQRIAPIAPGKKRPAWLSEEARQAIRHKAAAYKRMRWRRTAARKMKLAILLRIWKWAEHCDDDTKQWADWWWTAAAWEDGWSGYEMDMNRLMGYKVRAMVRRDKKKHVLSIINECSESMQASDAKRTAAALDKLKPRRRTPTQAIKDPEGIIARDPQQCRSMWLGYWEERFEGERVTMQDLMEAHKHKCRMAARATWEADEQEAQEPHGFDVPDDTLDGAFGFITVDKLARKFAKSNVKKTHGEDAIPALVYKEAAQIMAETMHPVMMKAWLTGLHPPQWGGGMTCELLKAPNKDHFLMSSYRPVVVSDYSGKAFHSFIRELLVPPLEKYLPKASYGGLPERSVQMAHQMTKLAVANEKKKGRTCTVLYTDTVGAFDYVRRRLVYDRENAASAGREAKINENHLKALASAHSLTWTSVQGMEELITTTRGSRAGDPLADAVFLLLIARVLERITVALDMAQLAYKIKWQPQQPIFAKKAGSRSDEEEEEDCSTTGYIDDIAFVGAARTVDRAMQDLKATASIVAHVFDDHDLRLNWSQDKTEAIIHAAGQGAKEYKVQRAKGQWQHLLVDTPAGPTQLRLVDSYIHLGSTAATKAPEGPEITRRRRMAKTAAVRIAPVLRRSDIPPEKKSRLIDTYYLSKLLFGAEHWNKLTQAQTKMLGAEYYRMHRLALGLHYVQAGRSTSAEDLADYGVVSMQVQLRKKRLLYAPKILSAPACLKAQVQRAARAGGGWVQLLREDMQWLRGFDQFRHLPEPSEKTDAWESAMLLPSWKKKVGEVVKSSTGLDRIKQPGGATEGAVVQDSMEVAYMCCGKAFYSDRALTRHNTAKHNYEDANWRYAFPDSKCRGCCTIFHSTRRLLLHYRSRPACIQKMQSDEILELDEIQITEAKKQALECTRRLRAAGRREAFADKVPLRCDTEHVALDLTIEVEMLEDEVV
eukprot:TRINITY_DN2962_c0_g1_i2.p1 TRINITY_DN2962_c0_g1~~TRINITY_DN2962_c0_g1_i2.p1  ORF type:complete len:1990 (-),score=421.20 TRINITY_DN2962_c0_g1_i2:153-6122(-)